MHRIYDSGRWNKCYLNYCDPIDVMEDRPAQNAWQGKEVECICIFYTIHCKSEKIYNK